MLPESMAYFDFGSWEKIAMTRALGHQGLTSTLGAQTIVIDVLEDYGPGSYRLVTTSDGVRDVVAEDNVTVDGEVYGENVAPVTVTPEGMEPFERFYKTDSEFLADPDVDAKAVATFALDRWENMWETVTHSGWEKGKKFDPFQLATREKQNGRDDISASVINFVVTRQ